MVREAIASMLTVNPVLSAHSTPMHKPSFELRSATFYRAQPTSISQVQSSSPSSMSFELSYHSFLAQYSAEWSLSLSFCYARGTSSGINYIVFFIVLFSCLCWLSMLFLHPIPRYQALAIDRTQTKIDGIMPGSTSSINQILVHPLISTT